MRSVVPVLVLAAVLAGCSPGGGQPNGASAAPPSAPNASDDPIPAVQAPKTLVGTSPCQLLTAAQLTAYRIDQAGRSKDVAGVPGCEWGNEAHTREIAMFVDIGLDVLHNIYAERTTYPVFEVTQVAGHPAIRTKNNAEGTSCFYRVAAAQRQTFTLRFTSLRQGLEEPCGPARALAEAVLANLPPLKS
jgi:hypothetical protein